MTIVNLSLSTNTAIESEGTVVTFNFEVEGDIPDGGLPINLDIDASSGALWITDFRNFSRTGVDADGNIVSSLRFNNSLGFGNDGGRPSAPGIDPFDSTTVTIQENIGSFEFEIFDDFFAEENETITFSIADGEGYTAGSDPVTLTLQDGPDGIITPVDGPTVGVTIETEADVLVEDLIDANTLTLTFDVEGEVGDGVQVVIESDTFDILGDFDVNSIVVDGIGEGGRLGPLSPLEFGRGVAFTILEDGATLTLDAANDGIEEGEDTFNFSLLPGELYNVDPDASTVSATIVDPTPTFTEGSKKGGTGQGDTIIGETNNEEIDAKGGDDFIDGNLGNDTILGGNGDDTLFGSDGVDSIIGGKGDDLIETGLAASGIDFADGGIGNDTILGGITEDGEFVGSFGNVILLGGSGEDFIQGGGQRATLEGGNGDDTIFGGGNDSVLDGGKGDDYLEAVGSTTGSGIPNFSDDTLTGGDGNDTLIAFADDDVLDGGAGNDILDGGLNEDTLTGGANQDIFVFRANDGDEIDIVTDFEVGIDQIGLDGLSFEDLSFSAGDSGLAMNLGDETLAIFEGVGALDADDFTIAPDFA